MKKSTRRIVIGVSLLVAGSFLVGAVGCVGLGGSAVVSVMSTLKSAAPVQDALALAETDPAGCLGTNVRSGWAVSGKSTWNNGNASVDVRVPVTGSAGAGTVWVKSEGRQGVWTHHAMELTCPDGSVHDLRPQPPMTGS